MIPELAICILQELAVPILYSSQRVVLYVRIGPGAFNSQSRSKLNISLFPMEFLGENVVLHYFASHFPLEN